MTYVSDLAKSVVEGKAFTTMNPLRTRSLSGIAIVCWRRRQWCPGDESPICKRVPCVYQPPGQPAPCIATGMREGEQALQPQR